MLAHAYMCVCRESTATAAVEYHLVVQAIRLNTLPKLTFADSKRFDALIRDIIPDVPFTDVQYPSLESALRDAFKDSNLVVMETQVKAVDRSGCCMCTESWYVTLWHNIYWQYTCTCSSYVARGSEASRNCPCPYQMTSFPFITSL